MPRISSQALDATAAREEIRVAVPGDPARADPLEAEPADQTPLSFVVCLADDATFRANLMTSPCLHPGSPHEVIAVRNAPSAADGLNLAIERAQYELVAFVRQDVLLPPGWDRLMVSQLRLAQRFGPVGVAGVYGVGDVIERPGQVLAARRIGRVVDRGRMLDDGPGLPARVATLDEPLLIARRDAPLRFGTPLGFHLDGADLCLQARQRGLAVVAIDALCHHNSRSVGLPESFYPGAAAFACKWARSLLVATPCVVFDREGQVYLLGDATGDRSVAHAQRLEREDVPLKVKGRRP